MKHTSTIYLRRAGCGYEKVGLARLLREAPCALHHKHDACWFKVMMLVAEGKSNGKYYGNVAVQNV